MAKYAIGVGFGTESGRAMLVDVNNVPGVGSYADIFEIRWRMARLRDEAYHPIPENQQVYERLYAEYVTSYNYFGCGANDVMKRHRQLRAEMPAS